MKFFLNFAGGLIGGSFALAVGLLAANAEKFQTLIGALIAVAATLLAALIAWFAVQRQIHEQRRQALTMERNELQRFMNFAEDLSKELTSYLINLKEADESFRTKSSDFELAATKCQRIPFSIPKYTDAHLSYNTTISLEALNSYISQYEAFASVDVKGIGIGRIVIERDKEERFKALLFGLERCSKRVLEDLAQFDTENADNRVHAIDRRLGSM